MQWWPQEHEIHCPSLYFIEADSLIEQMDGLMKDQLRLCLRGDTLKDGAVSSRMLCGAQIYDHYMVLLQDV